MAEIKIRWRRREETGEEERKGKEMNQGKEEEKGNNKKGAKINRERRAVDTVKWSQGDH